MVILGGGAVGEWVGELYNEMSDTVKVLVVLVFRGSQLNNWRECVLHKRL